MVNAPIILYPNKNPKKKLVNNSLKLAGAPITIDSSVGVNSPKDSFRFNSAYKTNPDATKAMATKNPNELTSLSPFNFTPNKSSIK